MSDLLSGEALKAVDLHLALQHFTEWRQRLDGRAPDDHDAAAFAYGLSLLADQGVLRTVSERDRLVKAAQREAPEAQDAQDALGLSIDMIDVDRLRTWAEKIETHGMDLSHWTTPSFASVWLKKFAHRLETTIHDIGHLRAQAQPEARERRTCGTCIHWNREPTSRGLRVAAATSDNRLCMVLEKILPPDFGCTLHEPRPLPDGGHGVSRWRSTGNTRRRSRVPTVTKWAGWARCSGSV